MKSPDVEMDQRFYQKVIMTNNDKRNIVLTGFMGTGKTTVGKLVAEKLKRQFVDTDELIQERQGLTIPEIFAQHGEVAFRQMEASLAEELGQRQELVISTGGRLMLDPKNVVALTRGGRVFCLIAIAQEILSRIASDDGHKRPLLEVANPEAQIVALLEERRKGYHCFQKIVTSGKNPQQVAEHLLNIFHDKPKRFLVETPAQSYEYIIGSGILPFIRQLTGVTGSLVVITDSVVGELYVQGCGDVDHVITIPSGNKKKTLATVEDICNELIAIGFDRDGTIVALGGRDVGDVAGFVAATYMRGVDFIQCPTSLLAMADTSIGGKTSIDLPGGKNVIGVFKQPLMVIADVATLQTLPAADFKSGMAEVIKHGLIADSTLLNLVEEGDWYHESGTLYTSLFDVQALVAQSIQVKIKFIEEDPFDHGKRFSLHLGHTFAHAIEQVSDYAIRHGDAVAMGMVVAANVSARLGLCSPDQQTRTELILQKVGLPIRLPKLSPERLLKAMENDKKRRGEVIQIVIPRGIGKTSVADDIPASEIKATLLELMPG
ncbi:MAG: 3-dehydroquinate synthase [Desulfotalea sp.]|nr:MAG: 3-dehydroquinate synthase [Desulfotalea sp.]